MGGNPFYFTFCSFLISLNFGWCYLCNNSLLSFCFGFWCQKQPLKRGRLICEFAVQKQISVPHCSKIQKNHRTSSVAANFWQKASGFFLPFSSFKFSDLRSRISLKQFIFTVCSVFADSVLSSALLLSQAKWSFFKATASLRPLWQ